MVSLCHACQTASGGKELVSHYFSFLLSLLMSILHSSCDWMMRSFAVRKRNMLLADTAPLPTCRHRAAGLTKQTRTQIQFVCRSRSKTLSSLLPCLFCGCVTWFRSCLRLLSRRYSSYGVQMPFCFLQVGKLGFS